MAQHEASAHASADDQYRETPPGAAYEHTDANVWIIVKFLWWLMLSAVIIHVGLGFFYEMLIQRSISVAEQPYPLASPQVDRLPPQPRLQQFPRNELYQFRIGEEEFLHNYGWMNKNAGVVHIPIDDAMRLTVERGLLSSRPVDAAAGPADPRLMPSDSSSGRMLEQRRQ